MAGYALVNAVASSVTVQDLLEGTFRWRIGLQPLQACSLLAEHMTSVLIKAVSLMVWYIWRVCFDMAQR